MSQNPNEPNSADQTIPASQSAPGATRKRSWLRIIIVIVVILGAIAAFRMWYDAKRLDELSARSPALPQVASNISSPERIINPTTGYSLMLPERWKPLERPGKPVSYIGPTRQDSTPSIQMMLEKHQGTLQQHVEMSLQQMKLGFKGFQLIEQQAFSNAQGTKGIRLTVSQQGTSRILQNRYYFFPHDDHTALILCATSSDRFGDELNSAFDACAQSVELKK